MNVRETYDAQLRFRGYQADPAQLRAIDALERCASEWAAYKEKRSNFVKKLINRPDVPRRGNATEDDRHRRCRRAHAREGEAAWIR